MTNLLRRLLGRGNTDNLRTQTQRRLETAKQAALHPTLYAQWGVPDTFDGRFEALLLMVSVEFGRLTRADNAPAADSLLSAFMQDVELALQASGVSEAGMRKKMRQVETASFARVEQIGASLRSDPLHAARHPQCHVQWTGQRAGYGVTTRQPAAPPVRRRARAGVSRRRY